MAVNEVYEVRCLEAKRFQCPFYPSLYLVKIFSSNSDLVAASEIYEVGCSHDG